jgi:hypothetical protein
MFKYDWPFITLYSSITNEEKKKFYSVYYLKEWISEVYRIKDKIDHKI